jgi:uracil-DNA glycosylase family 4
VRRNTPFETGKRLDYHDCCRRHQSLQSDRRMSLSLEDAAELLALTSSIRGYLEAEAELGVAGVAIPLRPFVAPALAPLPPVVPAPRPEQSQRSAPAPAPAPATAQVPASLLSLEDRRRRLQLMADEAASCTRCVLHEKRTQSVFARGNPESEIVFVGEGPGRDEDLQGLPFVGAAGQLLDRMIVAMGYARDDVYICNVVKCRPPDNRTPLPEEAAACSQFLVPQLQTVAPKAIVALGRCAAQALGVAQPTGSWRGRWGTWQGVPILPTYHPAYLLRSPEQKRTVWEDLQLVMARLGRPAARRGG